MTFTGSSSVIFANNAIFAAAGAGAIYGTYSNIVCSGNASVTFIFSK